MTLIYRTYFLHNNAQLISENYSKKKVLEDTEKHLYEVLLDRNREDPTEMEIEYYVECDCEETDETSEYEEFIIELDEFDLDL